MQLGGTAATEDLLLGLCRRRREAAVQHRRAEQAERLEVQLSEAPRNSNMDDKDIVAD